ncbi:MAG: type I restriction-modification system subunit M N-terminal domain-containing protein [Leptolyngbyaceae cyanobacterium]
MTNEQRRQLQQQLWNIADQLRGKMNADEFRDYCLGFVFYKYLSERLYLYANEILSEDGIDFLDIDEESEDEQELLEAVQNSQKMCCLLMPVGTIILRRRRIRIISGNGM